MSRPVLLSTSAEEMSLFFDILKGHLLLSSSYRSVASNVEPSISGLQSQFLALPEDMQKEVFALINKATDERTKKTSAKASAKAK